MAIRYLYPVPDPIVLVPDLPPGFELDDAQREGLPKLVADSVLNAFKNHRVFTSKRGMDQVDAIDLAITERAARVARGEPDYYALPGEAVKILQTCYQEPMFYLMVDGQAEWSRGLPWLPHVCRKLQPFFEMIMKPKDVKPAPPTAPAPEPELKDVTPVQ